MRRSSASNPARPNSSNLASGGADRRATSSALMRSSRARSPTPLATPDDFASPSSVTVEPGDCLRWPGASAATSTSCWARPEVSLTTMRPSSPSSPPTVRRGESTGPFPRQVLEVRPEDTGSEGRRSGPPAGFPPAVLEGGQAGGHHQLREPDNGVGERQRWTSSPEQILIVTNESGGAQHPERMHQRRAILADPGADRGRRPGSFGNGSEDRVINAAIGEPWILTKQIVGLREQRMGGVEHGGGKQPGRQASMAGRSRSL